MKTLIAILTATLVASSAFAADFPVRKRHVEEYTTGPVLVEPVGPLQVGIPGLVTVEPLPWTAKRHVFPFNPIPNVDIFGYRVLGGWNR